jgi:hypothetical protein
MLVLPVCLLTTNSSMFLLRGALFFSYNKYTILSYYYCRAGFRLGARVAPPGGGSGETLAPAPPPPFLAATRAAAATARPQGRWRRGPSSTLPTPFSLCVLISGGHGGDLPGSDGRIRARPVRICIQGRRICLLGVWIGRDAAATVGVGSGQRRQPARGCVEASA